MGSGALAGLISLPSLRLSLGTGFYCAALVAMHASPTLTELRFSLCYMESECRRCLSASW